MEKQLVINENMNSLLSDEIVMQWLLGLEADAQAEQRNMAPLLAAVG